MPQTKAKPSKSQQVRGKSEIDDLFSRLLILYQPGPFPPLSLPMFQGAEVPVLLFPTLQVAQARAWRNQNAPNSERLKAVINGVCRSGLAMGERKEEDSRFWKTKEEIGMVIAICETLFRPMRAVELSLERLFPDFLFLRGSDWPPSPTAVDQLASDFRHRWKEEEKICGREWVLAAGGTPLPVRHRPALIAPWVVGVVVKRWLAIKRTAEVEAIDLVSRLMAVLLDRKIRPEELLHWGGLLERVLVTTDNGKAPLPGYMVNPMARLTSPVVPDQLTPALFLQTFLIDRGSCEQFAQLLHKAWLPSDRTKSAIRTKRRAARQPDHRVFSCGLCKREQLSTEAIWPHLREVHHISETDMEIPERSDEIRQISTGKIIASWQEIGSN